MDKFGVNTQKWKLATTPEEAEKVAKELGLLDFILKSFG